MEIRASEFVKRQTRTSEFGYYDGPWAQVEQLAVENFENFRPGPRDGVVLVQVPPERFYTSIVPRDDTGDEIYYEHEMVSRRDGEKPVFKMIAYGFKQPAKRVDLVLYRKDVLEEDELDRDQLTGADWEIVSVNCSPTEEECPMTPMTMARNVLADDPEHGVGGTKTEYTAEEFARSIMFWNDHVMIREYKDDE